MLNVTPNNKEREPVSSETTQRIRLFPYEGAMAKPYKTPIVPISSLTWFQSSEGVNLFSCLKPQHRLLLLLKTRIQQILKANPWLSGSIQEDGEKYFLSYTKADISEAKIDGIFCGLSSPIASLSRETPVDILGQILMQHDLVLHSNGGSPHLLKVSVLPCALSPSSRFALVFSLSHSLGDGHTYYRLFDMLIGRQPIEALEATRILNTREAQTNLLGKDEVSIMKNLGFLLSMLRGLIMTKLIHPWLAENGHRRIGVRYFYVDKDKMNAFKQRVLEKNTKHPPSASLSPVPLFVSTNDVITSWFFRTCQAQHGLMAINLRNRLAGHTDALAGNYENVLYYQIPTDADSPTLIRKSVASFKRAVTSQYSLPSTIRMARDDWCIISNWASFEDSKLSIDLGPGVQQEIHLPVYDTAASVPSTLRSCIIFRAAPNKLAVCVSGTSSIIDYMMDECSFATEELFH